MPRTWHWRTELSARADIMIQNFKPGGLTRYGLDYDAVRARNETVIYCSISGFGAAGGAKLPGYDLLVQGMSGLMSLTGAPDGQPYRAGISVFDVMTGMHSVIGILSALHHRDLTGEGQHVETNLLSTALSALVNQTSAYVAGGVVPTRMGNSHLSLFPYEPLQTGDGELIIVAGNDGQFRKLAEVIGHPELADDPRFDTVGKRNDNREELRPAAAGGAVEQERPGLVRPPHRRRPAVRADQHRRRRRPARRGPGPGTGRRGRRGRRADGAQPDPAVAHPAELPPAPAGPRRARRRRPLLAGRPREGDRG